MKVVTFGVFDFFHYGHLKLLESAKALGDYLIVAVQRDGEITRNKPEATVLYNGIQRKELVKAIRYVDEVLDYSQVDEDIQTIDFDIFAIGEDQNHQGFKKAIKWCYDHNKRVVCMPRTPNICSSAIKEQILRD